MSNPDGYEFTFTPGNRLWRKNLHEQNGQPGIQNGDGVDPNRNFPVNWGLDNEGSSPDLASETYRGAERRVRARDEGDAEAVGDGRVRLPEERPHRGRADPLSAGLAAVHAGRRRSDLPALAGDDADPAIQGFDPDLGAELYITNGDTLDTAYNRKNILAYTPEGSEPHRPDGLRLRVRGRRGQDRRRVRDHLPFVLDLAESADDPDESGVAPRQHGATTTTSTRSPYSYGDPQTVQVLAKRDLGAVSMKYRINGGRRGPRRRRSGATASATTRRPAGEYHRLRGASPGRTPATRVEVWFEKADGQARSRSFTYSAESEPAAPDGSAC